MFNPLFSGCDELIKFVRHFAKTDFVPVIEIGLGQNTLLDHLLKDGFLNLTALDLSEQAIELARKRNVHFGSLIEWVCADVLTAPLKQNYYAFWHDSGVFNNLNTQEQREGYIGLLESSLRPGGHAVIYANAVFEEMINKSQELNLEVIDFNCRPLYSLYFGSSNALNNMPNKELRVIMKKS